MKDNCGVYAVRSFLMHKKVPKEKINQIIHSLEERVQGDMLSIYDLIMVLKDYGFSFVAYHSSPIQGEPPYLYYLTKNKHFMAVLEKNDGYLIDDVNTGKNRVPGLILRMMGKGIVIQEEKPKE